MLCGVYLLSGYDIRPHIRILGDKTDQWGLGRRWIYNIRGFTVGIVSVRKHGRDFAIMTPTAHEAPKPYYPPLFEMEINNEDLFLR